MTQCPADRCTSLTTAPLPSIAPDISIALHRYGSVKGQPGEISEFEYSSAIAFLGEDELLVCGARQGLARHAANERPEDHPHTVQALLWNRHTGQLERTAEWFVPNRQQYLWPLADGRVLVHDGEQLVWFGKGLQREASLPLDGPLAFVSATGDGRHTLVGTIRELHSKTEHAELYHSDNQAPEEQVREVVYDDKLRLVSEAEESSRAMPPLLWNDGRLMLRHRGGNLWYFREFAWDGSQRDFGTLTSSCIPHTAALAGDMLMVEGCETHSLNAWARVLRPDGSLVLRSTIRPDDLYPFASTRSLRSFVLVSPRLVPSANRDGVYHAADVAAETVRVVRSSDGVVEFAAEVHEPNTSFQPAAVDMHGSGVAILDGETVRLYCLPLTARAPLMQTGSR